MYCEHCGNKIEKSHSFCTKCGNLVVRDGALNGSPSKFVISADKWWHRLLKVIYIFLYLQVLWIVPAVWSVNSSEYVGYSFGQSQYRDTYGEAFWYSLLALLIFLVVIRLIKLTTLYIFWGHKPQWDLEFKKLF